MIESTGIPSKEKVLSKFPKESILTKPKAIIECYHEIPCNPCATSCPFDAITIGENINNIPRIDYEKCTGCGVCVFSCPGLAIMVSQIKEDKAIFKIPYEQLPLPKENEIWDGINRFGKTICKAKIIKILNNKATDRTAVITVSVPIKHLYEFITIRCPYE